MSVNPPTIPSGSETEKELHPLTERVGAGTYTTAPVTFGCDFDCVAFAFYLTARSNGGGDYLDVWVQQSWDGGQNWDDLVRFARVELAAPPAVEMQIATLPVWREDAQGELHSRQDGTIAAGTVVPTLVGRRFRVKLTLVDGSGTASFTFAVVAFVRPRRSR